MRILSSRKGAQMWRFVAVLMAALIAVSSLSGCLIIDFELPQQQTEQSSGSRSSGDVSRTIMVYIVGSNLESEAGLATTNIIQMIEADVDLNNINVLIQTGGANVWQNDVINDDKIAIYELLQDDIKLVREEPAKSMASPGTLTDFMTYCYDNYKTDEYSLILWNHGGGPIGGFGYDEVFDQTLSIGNLCQAFENSPFGSDNKLEWIGFDACLMGSIEVAFAFQKYADYLISSQEVEPGWGWNYNFLGDITPSMTAEDVAVDIIDSYMDLSNEIFEYNPRRYADITLSCMDLKKVSNAADKLDVLYGKARSSLDKGSFPDASRIRGEAKEFGILGTDSLFDLVDLKHLSSLMSVGFPEADDLISALDDLVVYNKSNVKNANGVSIYYPYNSDDEMDDLSELYKSINFSDDYSGYIGKFTYLRNESSFTDWDLSKLKIAATGDISNVDGVTFSMQLTPEQAENYAEADYVILMKINDEKGNKNDDFGYAVVYASTDVKLYGSGELEASFDGKIPKLRCTQTGEVTLCTMLEKERTDEYVRYRTLFMAYNNYDDAKDSNFDEGKFDSGFLQLQSDADGGDIEILSAVPFSDNGDSFVAPKQLIDIYDYNIVAFPYFGIIPTYDNSGNMKSWFDWEDTGRLYGREIELDQENQDSFEFFMEDIREVTNYQNIGQYASQEFVVMFNITDVQRNVHASDIMPIKIK